MQGRLKMCKVKSYSLNGLSYLMRIPFNLHRQYMQLETSLATLLSLWKGTNRLFLPYKECLIVERMNITNQAIFMTTNRNKGS